MKSGIKISKDMLPIYLMRDPIILALYTHIYLNASTIQNNIQITTSYNELCKITGISKQKIRTALKKLQLTQQLTQQSTHLNTVITIIKSNNYRGEKTAPNTQTNTATNTAEIFIAPTIDEFEQYFVKNGFSIELAQRVWKGYDIAEWHKANGKKILNWKQTCIQIWFKPENKSKKQNKLSEFNYQTTKI